MNWTIHPIALTDHAACCSLWQVSEGLGDVPDVDAFASLLRSNPGLGQVAHAADGGLVGAILATSDGIRGMFYRLAVSRAHRRQGLAKALVAAATQAVEATGVSRINIHIFADNQPAVAFWAAQGYATYEGLSTLYRRFAPAPIRLRPGVPDDLGGVMVLVAAVIAGMRAAGIDQWDEVYPDPTRIGQDLREGAATVAQDGGRILGLVVLNTHQDPPYATCAWSFRHPAVVHRLMVHPQAQGRGLARRLMAWAEGEAQRRGFDSIRLDAFIRNPVAMRLYPALGYIERGSGSFRKGEFRLFEKGWVACPTPSPTSV